MNSLRRLLLLLGALSLASAAMGHGLDGEVELLDDDTAVVAVNGREYTAGELKLLLSIRVAPYIRGEYLFFGVADLANTGFQDPGYRAIALEARREGVTLTGEQEARIEHRAREMARGALYRREVLDKLTAPEMDDLKALYEELKDSHLTVEERMVLREIHIPADAEGFEENASATAAEIWERLEAGEGFTALMGECNPPGTRSAPRMIVPSRGDETETQIAEVFRALGDGEYSRPFRTERGYHLIERQMHMDEGHVPLLSALDFLEERHLIDQKRRRIEAFFRPLIEDPAIFRPHVANLQSRGALALDDDVVARVHGRPLYRKDVAGSQGWQLSPEVPHSEEYFRELAVHAGPVQNALLDHIIDRDGLMDAPEIRLYKEAAEVTHLVRNHLRAVYDPAEHPVSDEEIGGYFRSNRETFPTDPRLWGRELEISVPGLESATLSEAGGDLSDVENFLEGLREIEGLEPVILDRRPLEGTPLSTLDEEARERVLALPPSGGVCLRIEDASGRAFVVNRWEGRDHPLPADAGVIRSYLEGEKFHRFVEARVLERSAETTIEGLIDF